MAVFIAFDGCCRGETPARSWHHDEVAKTPTTDEALCAFLAGERGRLSARSMRNYEYAVELLRDSLNGYGPNRLAGWLFEHGYVSADEREDGVEHGSRASRG